jgi:cytochrome oxidase Cu insertion factor (SCO1/SenC/PrrC family)
MSRHLPLAALAVAAALVVMLARQNRALRADQMALLDRATIAYAGMWVPSVPATTVDGAELRLGEPARGGAQVLYFFTTTCRYCKASVPALKKLASRLDSRVAMIGVSDEPAEDTRRYTRAHSLPFATASVPGRRVVGLFRARTVPLITVVNADGRATYTRYGTLESDAAIDSVVSAARAAATH